MSLSNLIVRLHVFFLSEKTKQRSEKAVLLIAIMSYVVHLTIFYLVYFGVIKLNKPSDLLSNPIAAIYTPFSFILVYEVYLLIYYLPKSFTTYIGKQYEVITLIIIRRLFKDLSNLNLTSDWFKVKYDLQFTYDLITSILMFFLIYVFYLQSKIEYKKIAIGIIKENESAVNKFIAIKKAIATLILPIFLVLTVYSFTNWLMGLNESLDSNSTSFTNINNIFFEEFFTILIFTDVLILLFSFFITDEFHKIIRNSGFIISTILIRISFSTSGLLNNLLIVCAIVFGISIVFIHNKFEKNISSEKVN